MYDSKPSDAVDAYNEAYQVYLDNWETKTRFAERNCEWDGDIQHRNHEAMESLSSSVQVLAVLLEDAMIRIEQLEAIIQNQK